MKRRIAILMTCHNRVETTLESLRRLLPQLSEEDKVFLVDDGSTDGTGERVRTEFSIVRVIEADGTLYWAKGMHKAWTTAVCEGEWEAYLWLNDDAMLTEDAIEKMLSKNDGRSLVVGELCDKTGKPVYGLNVNGWVNGNCVLVPKYVFEKVGMICGEYCHAWADSDYACRVKKAGCAILEGGNIGTTEWHPIRPQLAGKSLLERWHLLFDPKGWNLHDLWLYRRRNWSTLHAVVSVVHMFLHVLFSRIEHVECVE